MEIIRIKALLESFRSKHILVIGDVMLDEFIWGKVSRISPEAPVPVVEVTGESFYPGGAANVARNLKEFCQEAYVLGIVGDDRHGDQLKAIMSELGLNLRCLFDAEKFQTIVKTRIVARQQQMVRVDREQIIAPGKALVEAALASLEKIIPRIDAVIFEDYAKGLLTQDFVTQATRIITRAGKIVTADPNPKNPIEWLGLTAIKPNRQEAFRCAEVEENDPDEDFTDRSRLPEISQRLLRKWQTDSLLITLGENGMVLFERDKAPYHIPTRAQEVYDVSGAGDTAIALFTLALAAGATGREAAEISNLASSVVVGKLGTATVTPRELLASLERRTPASVDAREFILPNYSSNSKIEQLANESGRKQPANTQDVTVEKNALAEHVARETVQAGTTITRKKRRANPVKKRVFLHPDDPRRDPLGFMMVPTQKRSDFEVAKPAVFLDRDGTLMQEVGYCSDPAKVRLFDNITHSLYRLKQAGYLNIIVTNQSGIGRGMFTEADFRKVHCEMISQIGIAMIDGTYFCPDHPDQASNRRKPGIGMLQEAVNDFNIDLKRSWMIGDKTSDIECGQAAGLKTILVSTGYGTSETGTPDYRARDFASAVDWIVV